MTDLQLVTLPQVRAYFGQQATGALKALTPTDDDDLQALVDAASQRVQDDDLAGPVLPREVVEWHDGDDEDLLLRRPPVLQVLEVAEYRRGGAVQLLVESTAATAVGGYVLEPETGLLSRVHAGGDPRCWWPGRRNVRVTYTAGRLSVPPVVTTATCELVWHWWQWRRGGSPTFQPGGSAGFTGGGGTSHAVPWRVRQLLGNELRAPALG